MFSMYRLAHDVAPTGQYTFSPKLPHLLSNHGQLMVSSAPGGRESLNFVASEPAFHVRFFPLRFSSSLIVILIPLSYLSYLYVVLIPLPFA